MNDNELATRFTDESYLTRAEVSGVLGTSLIDPIWNSILAYRNQYRRRLGISDVAKIPFSLCYAPKIEENVSTLEKKLSEYIVNFGALNDGSISKYTLFREMCIKMLKDIAKTNHININDVALNNIVEYKQVDNIYEHLVRYYSAIVRLEKKPSPEFSLETISEYYKVISGQENLDSIYRKSEINSQSQRLLINREYAGAPVREIEGQMASLINYINTSKDSSIVKASVLTYMINYVKPFEKYNKEMSVILSKIIIANDDVESAAVYIPFETIVVDDDGKFSSVSREIQRSRDLTYMLTLFIKLFDDSLQVVADRIAQLTIDGVKNSFFLGEDPEEFKEEFGFEAPAEMVEPKKEEPVQVVPEVVEKEDSPKAVHQEAAKINIAEDEELSDKQLKRLASKLLESDPFLKKGQAHFYVRHCTKGSYYTIQQYKKCEGCVYETARTSMDNLAKLGYYRRESIKNKFVYTPIDKE